MDQQLSKDYYHVLEITKVASHQQIKEAYMKLKAVYAESNQALYSLVSPDEMMDAMKDIDTAYEVLSHTEKRNAYDRSLELENETDSRADVLIRASASANEHEIPSWDPLKKFERKNEPQPIFEGLDLKLKTVTQPKTFSTYTSSGVKKFVADCSKNKDYLTKITALTAQNKDASSDLFKEIRQLSGVSLEEIQENTKVSMEYIENIEENRLERLPQPVYVKGFLKSYLKYLAVPDVESLVFKFMERFKKWSQQ